MVASLVKFNAGKVQYDEDTKKCLPLPHKGVISIKPSAEEDSFYDFIWTPKSGSGNVESDDLLIIPGDVTFKQVKSCKTGRVFALTFLSSGAKNLYWLQDVGDDEELDKLTEKDELIVKKISDLLMVEDDDDEEEEEEDNEVEGTEEAEDVKMKQEEEEEVKQEGQ